MDFEMYLVFTVIAAAVSLVIWYFLMKAAVRNGTLEANERMGTYRASVSELPDTWSTPVTPPSWLAGNQPIARDGVERPPRRTSDYDNDLYDTW